MKRSITIILAWTVLITLSYAQFPELINYQGRLLDGTNLVNDTPIIITRFFRDPSGGLEFFAETNTVTVVDGLYTIAIGGTLSEGTLAEMFQDGAVYLELEVNGITLLPREQLLASGYSILAHSVRAGGVQNGMIADGAVDFNKLSQKYQSGRLNLQVLSDSFNAQSYSFQPVSLMTSITFPHTFLINPVGWIVKSSFAYNGLGS